MIRDPLASRATSHGTRAITISVTNKVYDKLTEMGRARSLSTTAYASALLHAAYSARAQPDGSGDQELDQVVAGALILRAHGHETETIAKVLGISEIVAARIETAWNTARRP